MRGDQRAGRIDEADARGWLLDPGRPRPHEGRIYVVLTEDGLVAKCAGRTDDEWMLLSAAGPPGWPPAPWRGAEVKGEVIWTARTLAATSR